MSENSPSDTTSRPDAPAGTDNPSSTSDSTTSSSSAPKNSSLYAQRNRKKQKQKEGLTNLIHEKKNWLIHKLYTRQEFTPVSGGLAEHTRLTVEALVE